MVFFLALRLLLFGEWRVSVHWEINVVRRNALEPGFKYFGTCPRRVIAAVKSDHHQQQQQQQTREQCVTLDMYRT